MAFGIKRNELEAWKAAVSRGEISYITHYWVEPRFPGITTITKVGCANLDRLRAWCNKHRLPPERIHMRDAYPHFDLIGPRQYEILKQEQLWDQIERFKLQEWYERNKSF
ncbi:hypothetical protein [Paenibacillus guangzhouensis]|uniref:hypothetical protein n=1 Tax=Paenibacillus guangzhouensis TaxID=1473112 RepID=UPI001266FA4F|nr:hypothetical protein [Paenibacillus guangzhouensis]